MERHANKNNVRETIKVPLQGLSKSGETIFAYLRRSTKKEEQADSLLQQTEGVHYIAKTLGISEGDISYFIESRSGFENRTRKEWNRMLEEIDKQKTPCTILCRDTSRLSRNPKDNLAIADRMFGDNDFKKKGQKIRNIFFLEGDLIIKEWNKNTGKSTVADTLHKNYMDSLGTKDKSGTGHKLKLEAKELPFASPHGITRVIKTGEPYRKSLHKGQPTTLKQDEEMPFIKRAFEMKIEGRSANEISRYLKQYGKINIAPKKIVETIIQNSVYKGVYTLKNTDNKIEKPLLFWEGKAPIDIELWEKANAKVGKRGSGFGEGQAEHIAQGLLKYESGKNLSMYKAKGKYNAYQTEIKGENGKRRSIGIMESTLVNEFLGEVIPKLQFIVYKLYVINACDIAIDRLEESIIQCEIDEAKGNLSDIELERMFLKDVAERRDKILSSQNEKDLEKKGILDTYGSIDIFFLRNKHKNLWLKDTENKLECLREHFNGRGIDGDLGDCLYNVFKRVLVEDTVNATDLAFCTIKQKAKDGMDSDKLGELIAIEDQKKVLEQKKGELIKMKDSIEDDAWERGFDMNFVNRKKGEIDTAILDIESRIDFFSQSTNIDEYLDRLPEILQNLHELSSRVLSDADYVGWRDDIKQLIEIVSHELILNNKKELKIELHPTINNLFFGTNTLMELYRGSSHELLKEFVENYDRVKEKYGDSF